MNFQTLLLRNLRFYRRTHFYTILGAAVGTAILTGALMIGDSVRYSLRQMVFERLGKTEFVLETRERFFRTHLADEMTGVLQTPVVPLLKTDGIAIAGGGEHRVNRVQVFGVDARFNNLSEDVHIYNSLTDKEIIINDQLASRLQVHAGDEILLRLAKLDYLPKDVPIALDSDLSITLRLTVKGIADGSQMGHFSLQTNQVAPNLAFISLSQLAQAMNLNGRANILLITERILNPLTHDLLDTTLQRIWKPEDAGLELIHLADQHLIELRSERIFLAAPLIDAALKADPAAQKIFTYFVNRIQTGKKETPYSFISAAGRPVVPTSMQDHEIIINEWTAQDLQARAGDSLQISYYIPGSGRRLIEKTSRFILNKIVPISGIYADRELMPPFPGLSDQENCRDWQPGIPIDLDKIRSKDEAYWDTYRGIPKAFVTLNAAEKMWQNRFGDCTAIRFNSTDKEKIYQKLVSLLDPRYLGFVFRNVREEGLKASTQSVDFAQLFIGLSFFIIMAALLLTALLFVFGVEQRAQENGLYLALGLPAGYIKRLIFTEGAVLSISGGVIGGILAVVYNQFIIYALNTLWIDAVGTSALHIHLDFITLMTGICTGIVLSFLTMWMVMRRQIRQSISTLQAGGAAIDTKQGKRRTWISAGISILCFSSVLLILIQTDPSRGREAANAFFAAGALLLTGCIALINMVLIFISGRISVEQLRLRTIGTRNLARRRNRSLTLIGLLAGGLFIVFMVGANRHGAVMDADLNSSGTGGFTFFAETVLPLLYDLNSNKGKTFYRLNEADLPEMEVVSFRVKEGDDASCLNLNRVAQPQLLGVDARLLARRESFTFATLVNNTFPENPWLLLNQPAGAVIPAIADETVIIWGLGKSVGDTLTYQDEAGHMFSVRLVGGLANSVFQGNILISEKAFLEKYPSQSGYQLFLIDVKGEGKEKVARQLNWSLQDLGIDLVSAAERLASFNKVENTYLAIFLILGGLGIILGTVGLGIVILRTVGERRGELALLRAVGYGRRALHQLLLYEYGILLIAGLLSGAISALIAALPAILSPGMDIPYGMVGMIFIGILLSGAFWIYFAIRLAIRGDLLPALRNE